MMYKLIYQSSGVLRLSDGASIPDNPLNKDWQEYLAWLALDNTPTPADVPMPEPVRPFGHAKGEVELPKVDDVDKMTELSELKGVIKLLIERVGG